MEKTLAAADHLRVIHNENGDREDTYLDCGIETVNGCGRAARRLGRRSRAGQGRHGRRRASMPRSIGKPRDDHRCRHATRCARENWDQLEPSDAVLDRPERIAGSRRAPGRENPFKAPDADLPVPAEVRLPRDAGRAAVPAADRLDGRLACRRDADRRGDRRLRAAPARLAMDRTVVRHLRPRRGAGAAPQMHSHHSWVRCRLAAEFCRSALATWGLPRAAPLLQHLDLAGARGLARSLYILHTRSSATRPVPIEEFKRIYLEKRIDDQLAYYDRQVNRAHAALQAADGGFLGRARFRPSCSRRSTRSPGRWTPRCRTGSRGRLSCSCRSPCRSWRPPASPSFRSTTCSAAWRATGKCAPCSQASRAQIASCQTWNSLEHVVLKTERALLQEVIEWHSIRSFSESH